MSVCVSRKPIGCLLEIRHRVLARFLDHERIVALARAGGFDGRVAPIGDVRVVQFVQIADAALTAPPCQRQQNEQRNDHSGRRPPVSRQPVEPGSRLGRAPGPASFSRPVRARARAQAARCSPPPAAAASASAVRPRVVVPRWRAAPGWFGPAAPLFRDRCRGRRRGRHAELALQGAKLAVAYIDQAMRGRELRFQILDAILERLCFCVGGIRIAASGGAAARAGRHQAQVSVGGAAAGAAPRIHLTMHFADRFALIQGGNLIRAGETQHGAAPQYVDISTECIGIRPVHRHHGLIDVGGGRGTRVGTQTARNLGKRVALGHAVAAAADGRRLRCRTGGRCACGRCTGGRCCRRGAPGRRRSGAPAPVRHGGLGERLRWVRSRGRRCSRSRPVCTPEDRAERCIRASDGRAPNSPRPGTSRKARGWRPWNAPARRRVRPCPCLP